MASVAELEAGLISERTKLLSRLQSAGVKLGNPNGAAGRCAGSRQAMLKGASRYQANAQVTLRT